MGDKVRVEFYFMIRKAAGQSRTEMEIANTTLNGLLNNLAVQFGKKFQEELFDPDNNQIRPLYQILVNGRPYLKLPDHLDTILKDGDVIAIFSPVGGG